MLSKEDNDLLTRTGAGTPQSRQTLAGSTGS